MKIKEVVDRLHVSADTLRYYERINLIPHIPRDANGVRNYSEAHIKWIQGILLLKSTGMSIEMLVEYTQLSLQGAATIETRKNILIEEQQRLIKEVNALQNSLNMLNHKIDNFYIEVLPKTERVLHEMEQFNDTISKG